MIKERVAELKFHKSLVPLRQARKALLDLVPRLFLKLNNSRRRALLKEFQRCTTVEDCIGFTQRHMGVGSCQIPWEIESALGEIAKTHPKVVCEIGTFDGGTSLLFSKFLPTVDLILCIDLHVRSKGILRLLARSGQSFEFFDMPSSSLQTVEKVSKFLDGRAIDALFIDGDHRYEGVLQDFQSYRSLVKEGGLVLFHDIVETTGRTAAWAGGVPKLWKNLSPHYRHTEYIRSGDQEGFGIGILNYTHAARPLPQ